MQQKRLGVCNQKVFGIPRKKRKQSGAAACSHSPPAPPRPSRPLPRGGEIERARHYRTQASQVETVSQRSSDWQESGVGGRRSGDKQKNKPGRSWGQEEGADQSGRGRICQGECVVLRVRLCTYSRPVHVRGAWGCVEPGPLAPARAPPRVKRRPAAGSSPPRPRGRTDALTRPTAPWAHRRVPGGLSDRRPATRGCSTRATSCPRTEAAGPSGSQEHQAAQMRAPLCLLLLLAHAVDMLALYRRKKQGTDVAGLVVG